MNKRMNAPKILPWIAKKAGISDELALKLWRRAQSEAEHLTGKAEGSDYWELAVGRFLTIVEDEIGGVPEYGVSLVPRFNWMWEHQARMSMLMIDTAENTFRSWQNAWNEISTHKKDAA